MNALADIVLLRPLWALAIPVVILLAVLAQRRASRPGDWASQIQPHLMAALARMGRVETGRDRIGAALPFVAAGLIALALVGPAVERSRAQTFRNLDGVIFVMDLSGSMTRDASYPTAVTLVRAGISALGSKPAALIVYAGDSYLASPLTTDHLQLGQTVSLLDADTVPDRGNRPELALGLAAQVIEEGPILAAQVLLVTDGAGLGPASLAQARRIADNGAQLSVLRLETSVSDQPAVSVEEMQTLVQIGNGALFGPGDLTALMKALGSSGPGLLERRDLRLLVLEDYGRYLLLFALFPALLFFRREKS